MGIRSIIKNFQSCPDDLGVMLEFWNTDSELLLYILTGYPHSQAPQASCGEKRTQRWKRVRAQKTCALREGLRYEEVGVVPIEHLAANNRKNINTVKQPIYTIWPKWSKCYRIEFTLNRNPWLYQIRYILCCFLKPWPASRVSPRVYSSLLPRSPTSRVLHYSSACYAGYPPPPAP